MSFQPLLSALSFGLAHRDNSIMTPKRLIQAVTRARARARGRAWIAFVAGAASALSQPPSYLWPILFLTFPLLVWLIDGAPAQRWRGAGVCAITGWCFGFGYFVVGLYWVGHAFLVDAETFGWLLPIAVTGGPAYLAIYTAIGFACARLLWVRGAVRILAFAVALTAAEWLRGNALTGFPWNAFGYALTSPLELAQIASLVGIWGLTFIAIAVFASPAALTDDRADTARPWLPVVSGLAVLTALALFGSWRLSAIPKSLVAGVELRIMQPNLQQDSKFNYSAKAQVMSQYIGLSSKETDLRPHGLRDVTHLIWPESAFPFYLNSEPDALAQIALMLPDGTVLITGADRTGGPPPSAASTDTHTSIYVIDHHGLVLGLYDKVHLVPFGEYLSFQNLLERLGLPTPNQRMASGVQAMGGIGRSASTSGLMKSERIRNQPRTTPSVSPTTAASAKPTSTRSILAPTWRSSVPLSIRSPAAVTNVLGAGSNTALISPAEARISQAMRKTAKPSTLRKALPLARRAAGSARDYKNRAWNTLLFPQRTSSGVARHRASTYSSPGQCR